MDRLDLYRCSICGNVVEIFVNGGGELVCCGKPMEKLEPKTHEEAVEEKHVPIFISHSENSCEIRVGEVLHPMTNEHYIQFLEAISPDKKIVNVKFFNPNEEPKFLLTDVLDGAYAREFCNIHGLWEGKND